MARAKRTSSATRSAGGDPAGRAALLAAAPLLVGGAIALTAALAAGNTPLARWLRSVLAAGGTKTRDMRHLLSQYARGQQPFSALRTAIIGSAKGAVKTVFGPPHTAMLGRGGTTLSIWRADTWYYPLDRTERSAIAIRFQGNVARDVEKITVPTAMIE